MRLVKEISGDATKICFREEEGQMTILYASRGNGDLGWAIFSRKSGTEHKIVIDKDNNAYPVFDELYNTIASAKIFEDDDVELYKKYNKSLYNDLFNEKTKTITWHSDNAYYECANILKIIKKDDSFHIVFSIQPSIEGKNEDTNSKNYITIRICNEGCRYYPFNLAFMEMFNKLVNIEFDEIEDHNKEESFVKKIGRL